MIESDEHVCPAVKSPADLAMKLFAFTSGEEHALSQPLAGESAPLLGNHRNST